MRPPLAATRKICPAVLFRLRRCSSEAPATLRRRPRLRRREISPSGPSVARKNAQPLADPIRRAVQGFHRDNAGSHVFPFKRCLQANEHAGAFRQKIAILIETFLKQNCFILAGLIRKGNDPHLRARLGPAFVPVQHCRGEPRGGRALLDRAGELGEALHP